MLADRPLQLHSSAAQSPVLGAARPFRFPRAASHSDIPTPGSSPCHRCRRAGQDHRGGHWCWQAQSLKPVFSGEPSLGRRCAWGPGRPAGLPVLAVGDRPRGRLFPPSAEAQVSLEQGGTWQGVMGRAGSI